MILLPPHLFCWLGRLVTASVLLGTRFMQIRQPMPGVWLTGLLQDYGHVTQIIIAALPERRFPQTRVFHLSTTEHITLHMPCGSRPTAASMCIPPTVIQVFLRTPSM